MKENKLRYLLNNNLPSSATRLWGSAPFYTEVVGSIGKFDYIEFVAEYSPYTIYDFENIARAAELHNMGSMIKVDLQNRGYVAQKAVTSGFQAVLFSDHETADQVRETVRMMKPKTPEDGGTFGFPNGRYIGTQSHMPQLDHAKRVRDIVLCFMIEKVETMENIEEICSVSGVDMVQFGPSDYCMSRGWNRADHIEEFKEAERKMIEVALKHGVQPRCEISNAEAAKYYANLGVKHFSLIDDVYALKAFWNGEGSKIRDLADSLK